MAPRSCRDKREESNRDRSNAQCLWRLPCTAAASNPPRRDRPTTWPSCCSGGDPFHAALLGAPLVRQFRGDQDGGPRGYGQRVPMDQSALLHPAAGGGRRGRRRDDLRTEPGRRCRSGCAPPGGCAAAPTVASRPLLQVGLPVLEGALERSVALAAAMDARGYGRTRRGAAAPSGTPPPSSPSAGCSASARVRTGCWPTQGAAYGLPLLLAGLAAALAGLRLGGRRLGPHPLPARPVGRRAPGWWPGSGAAVAAADDLGGRRADPAALHPPRRPAHRARPPAVAGRRPC